MVSILRNEGYRSFSEPERYVVCQGTSCRGFQPSSVAFGDLDGDGDLDLAVSDAGFQCDIQGPDAGELWIFTNSGDGTFSMPRAYGGYYSGMNLLLDDLDQDGDLDAIVAQGSWGPDPYFVVVYANQGDATFDDGTVVADEWVVHPAYMNDFLRAIALADLDGDGDSDLVTVEDYLDVVVRFNDGHGAFGLGTAYALPYVLQHDVMGNKHVAVGDVDDDGDADLVVVQNFGVSIMLNEGDGTFSGTPEPPPNDFRILAEDIVYELPDEIVMWGYTAALGDVDDDHRLDVTVACYPSHLAVMKNTCTVPCVADLDGSGDVGFPDLTQLLGSWGPCPGCPEDLDGDGLVGFTDLTMLLSVWGPCAP